MSKQAGTTSTGTKLRNPLRNVGASNNTGNNTFNTGNQQNDIQVNQLNSKVRDLASENNTLRNQIQEILQSQNLKAGVDSNGRPTGDDAVSVNGTQQYSSRINIESIQNHSSEALIELIKNLKDENENLRDSLYNQEATSEHINQLEEAIEKRDESHKVLEDRYTPFFFHHFFEKFYILT